MKALRVVFFLIALAASAAQPQRAIAGIPVIDFGNLANAVEQLAAWGKQHAQMVQQYQQLVRQYESTVGNRGLAEAAFNVALREVLPNGLMDIFEAVNSGSLTAAAQAIRNAQRLYDCTGLLMPADTQRCNAVLNRIAESQAQARGTYARLVERSNQIDQLRLLINSTQDPKDIAELQARLQAEIAQVNNDGNRIQMMVHMDRIQRERAEQQLREAALANLQSEDDGVAGLADAVRDAWLNRGARAP